MNKDLHSLSPSIAEDRPSRADAEDAVRTLLRYIGENPERDGLKKTPKRVIGAFEEFFVGYSEDPHEVLTHTFEEIEDYKGFVLLRGIPFTSHCEHHILPISGEAHVAYIPSGGVVGISKLARVVEIFAKRLQTQESMTVDIANVIQQSLQPLGVAVIISAEHQCMSMRGVHKPGVRTVTAHRIGKFTDDQLWRDFKDQISQ